MGGVNVNFDAETERESLCEEDYEKVYDLGVHWSETFQASHGSNRITQAHRLLTDYGRLLGANIVIGNRAYGLTPSSSLLESAGTRLSTISSNRQIKLGAEGEKNGKKAIDLALKTNSIAYILHTPIANLLMDYARASAVKYALYTLCRIGESEALAASDLMRIKGTAYFERRGVLRDNISTQLNNFAVYGTGEEVTKKIRDYVDVKGASKVVLYPVFDSFKDLLGQMRLLSRSME